MNFNASPETLLSIQEFAKKHIDKYNEKFLHKPMCTFMCNFAEDLERNITHSISKLVCENEFALASHIMNVVKIHRYDSIESYQVAHAFWNDFVENGRLWTHSKIQQEYEH